MIKPKKIYLTRFGLMNSIRVASKTTIVLFCSIIKENELVCNLNYKYKKISQRIFIFVCSFDRGYMPEVSIPPPRNSDAKK